MKTRMKMHLQNYSFSLKKLYKTIGDIDQNIEEWVNNFISQIDTESTIK
ncbi:MAG: hypothetical protein WEA58_02690 [Balneolaceae bacterium]